MYQSFVGLETHIHLSTQSKMFCSCKAHFGDEPNTNVCPVCLGYPGVLPVVNQEAVRLGYLVAKALNCELSPISVFERKNYFYPDMPKNYQISQFEHPVGKNGWVDVPTSKGIKRIRIHDVHLEEDAGKMIHAGDMTLIDYNRAGYPLLEIVTEPDLENGEEAEEYLKNFQRIVRYLGVSDGNMEEGSLKCDANVSINHPGKGLGTKVEIKNLNSSRFVKLSLNYEIKRQSEVLDEGGTLIQETRNWNENRDMTTPMRTKESSNDYRYFPEPDMPPFEPSAEFLAEVEKHLVELPANRKIRMIEEYSLTDEQGEILHETKYLADFFEEAAQLSQDPKAVATWMTAEVRKQLNQRHLNIEDSPLTPQRLSDLLAQFLREPSVEKLPRTSWIQCLKRIKIPPQLSRKKVLSRFRINPSSQGMVQEVFQDNPHVLEAIKGGEDRQRGFIVGQVMKKSGGKAAPEVVQAVISEAIG
jgi:aspartyl-tRNA(Asn)/glutamyl-tRNA(Gln) amidotransferase subunit B